MSGFASLHSGLLARKGQAEPSVQAAALAASAPSPKTEPQDRCAIERRDADPWPPPRLDPRPVLRVLPPAPAPGRGAPPPPPPPRTEEGVRLELRLTQDQARRLGLAAARLGRRRSALMGQALEAYLSVLGDGVMRDCACYGGSRRTPSDGCCGERA